MFLMFLTHMLIFCVNKMLFTIQFIYLFFMYDLNYKNLKFKHLICYLLFNLYTFFFYAKFKLQKLEI